MLELRRRFKAEVVRLSEYLDRDLVSLWGYDELSERLSSRGRGRWRTEQRVPDFFIVGQPKSGTTALYEMLRQHPQIYMPELKEPLFLASDLPGEIRTPPSRATDRKPSRTICRCSPPRRRSSAPARPPPVPALARGRRDIAELQPHARIVAIFREPASFLRSLHLQLLQNHIETQKDLRKALAARARQAPGRAYSQPLRASRRRCSIRSGCATWSTCAATTRRFPASRCRY